MIDCQTILPIFPAKMVEVVVSSVEVRVGSQEVAGDNQGVEGAHVKQEEDFAALDMKLLHRRVGHIGKGGMDRLAREGLVRELEGGHCVPRWSCCSVTYKALRSFCRLNRFTFASGM